MITKEKVELLLSDNITVKEYDAIVFEIDARFTEICKKFLILGPNSWFDYDNLDYDSENSNGYFDIENYKENIGIGGEGIKAPGNYDLSFPTRWLWEENWEEEMRDTIIKDKIKEQKTKELKKLKRKESLEKKNKLKKSILSKLTAEELKLVKFKV
jgi:hypothetical protein